MIVVVVHFMSAFLPFVIFGDQPNSTSHLPALEAWFFYPPMGLLIAGQLAVSLFFILSGYVLSYRFLGQPVSLAKTLEMTAKRPIRLGGLVWFSMSLYALFWYMGWFHNAAAADITGSHKWLSLWWQGDMDVAGFFKDLFTQSFSQGTVYNNPLWTIGFELYGSLLVFAFLLIFSRFKYRLGVLLLMVVLFYDSMLVGFWLGVILADLNQQPAISWPRQLQSPRIQSLLIWTMTILFLWLSAFPFYLPLELTNQTNYAFLPDGFNFGLGYPMVAALLGFILVLISRTYQQILCAKTFQYLGHISYAIYVMHVFVIGTFASWLFVHLQPVLGYPWSLFLVFFSGVLLSILLAHWVTKWVDGPAIKTAQWVGYKVNSMAQKNPIKKIFRWLEINLLQHPEENQNEQPPEN